MRVINSNLDAPSIYLSNLHIPCRPWCTGLWTIESSSFGVSFLLRGHYLNFPTPLHSRLPLQRPLRLRVSTSSWINIALPVPYKQGVGSPILLKVWLITQFFHVMPEGLLVQVIVKVHVASGFNCLTSLVWRSWFVLKKMAHSPLIWETAGHPLHLHIIIRIQSLPAWKRVSFTVRCSMKLTMG